MEYPSVPDPMYSSYERRRSHTAQSDTVRTDHADQDLTVTMPPLQQQMPQVIKCEGSPPGPDARHLPQSFVPPEAHSHSYPSPEPASFYGSTLPPHLISRSQPWVAPQPSPWVGDVSNYSFAPSQRLPLGGISPSTSQDWESSQQYPQVAYRQQLDYQQPQYQQQRYPSISNETLSCYSQLAMPVAGSSTDDFSYGNYTVTSGPTMQEFVSYRRFPPDGYTSAPSHSRPLAAATTFPPPPAASSYPDPAPGDAGMASAPMTPVSNMDEELDSGSYEDALGDGGSGIDVEGKEPGEPKTGETPYAQLIYQAFMSSPRRAMTLQEIYQWFRENTDKGRSGQGKGWQNSIRHNLSMNGAFERKPVQSDGNEGDDGVSPAGTSKRATEWVLTEDAVKNGVLSTTRYRNTGRRGQNKRNSSSRLKAKAAQSSPRRTARRRMAPRDVAHPYALSPNMAYTSGPNRPRYYSSGNSTYDLSAAEQLQRLSLAPAHRFAGQYVYEYSQPGTISSPAETQLQSGYASAPLSYSSELFLPSVPGAPTVTSEDDVNEVVTPEASYATLEPTVCGEIGPAQVGPTSHPYNRTPSTGLYDGATEPMDSLPRYSMSDVAGVCHGHDDMLRSCDWEQESSA